MMKSKMTRILSVLLALVMLLALVSCGQKPAEEDEGEPEATTQEITDMAGRTLTIPAKPEKIMGYNAMAQNLMYTLAPEKMSSLGSAPSEGEAYFYPDSVKNLPVLGDNSGKRTMNPEEVIAAAPDFILHVTYINDNMIAKAEELQQQLNIPIVMVSAKLDNIAETYRFVGGIIGCEEQAEKLASYAEKVVKDLSDRAATIADADRVTYYYAEGDDGLQTDPSGSDHTRAFDAVNALNCVTLEDYDAYYGRAGISMEQIMELDPDYVIFCPGDSIFSSDSTSICQNLMDGKDEGNWQVLKAVKEGRYFEAPYGLANAIDRPATVNLLYGSQWLGNLFYPDVFDYDMEAVTKEFYSLFYHYELSDAELATLLSRATVR